MVVGGGLIDGGNDNIECVEKPKNVKKCNKKIAKWLRKGEQKVEKECGKLIRKWEKKGRPTKMKACVCTCLKRGILIQYF